MGHRNGHIILLINESLTLQMYLMAKSERLIVDKSVMAGRPIESIDIDKHLKTFPSFELRRSRVKIKIYT